MKMPEPDADVIARRAEIARALARIVPGDGTIDDRDALRAYESDGLTAYRQPPMIAVLPETVAQVSAVLRYCHENGIKVVPRGAGTSLSGGALPLADGVLLGLGKFNRISRHRLRQPLRHGPAGRRQPRHQPGGRGGGLLLRARPVEPDRVLDRRQRRRERGRRPLPQIRAHRQQPARRRAGPDGRRGGAHRRPAPGFGRATTCSASSPDRKGCSA